MLRKTLVLLSLPLACSACASAGPVDAEAGVERVWVPARTVRVKARASIPARAATADGAMVFRRPVSRKDSIVYEPAVLRAPQSPPADSARESEAWQTKEIPGHYRLIYRGEPCKPGDPFFLPALTSSSRDGLRVDREARRSARKTGREARRFGRRIDREIQRILE